MKTDDFYVCTLKNPFRWQYCALNNVRKINLLFMRFSFEIFLCKQCRRGISHLPKSRINSDPHLSSQVGSEVDQKILASEDGISMYNRSKNTQTIMLELYVTASKTTSDQI